jgi:hypothetical protein
VALFFLLSQVDLVFAAVGTATPGVTSGSIPGVWIWESGLMNDPPTGTENKLPQLRIIKLVGGFIRLVDW